MKIKLNIGQTREEKTVEMDESLIAKCEMESRWQLGVALINGIKRMVQRRIQLGEWVYRFDGHILDPSGIEAYLPNEWLEWRDDA